MRLAAEENRETIRVTEGNTDTVHKSVLTKALVQCALDTLDTQ